MIQGTATIFTPGATRPRSRFFDPERVVFFERAGWEAYYERKWPRVLWLMVQLHREQFGMSLPLALAAALDIARASRTFAPQDNDLLTTLEYLRRYYAKARRARPNRASADTLARLELAYYRYEFAGYMQWSRLLGEAILASPEAHVVRHELIEAGHSAVRAQRGFQRWKYLWAAAEARASYEMLQRAADRIGVYVDPPYAATGATARTSPPERVEHRIDWSMSDLLRTSR